MKILVTGSHFTAAQAVIEQLQKHPGVNIVYLGRAYTREGDPTPSVESQVLPKLGVKFVPLISGRLQRSFTRYTIPSLLKIPFGFIQAFYLLLKERPSVVLSFGGYLGVPVVISAWALSIPVIIHEQTLVTGLANEISSLFADKIAVSFNKNMGKKMILTGNPIRKELLASFKQQKAGNLTTDYHKILEVSKKEKLPLIYITGGNQGSHIINETVYQILEELTKKACVIHQTGDSKFQDHDKLVAKQRELSFPQRYIVKKWVTTAELASFVKQIDLAISRGGINTLYELAYFGIPALVIPFPYLYKDEQTTNARYFAQLGMAQVLEQRDLSAPTLLEKVQQLLKQLPQRKKQAQGARSLVIPDASKRLALETLLLGRA